MACLDEELIVAFAEGRLAAEAIARVEAHTAACAPCQDLLMAALAAGTVGRSMRAVAGSRSAFVPGVLSHEAGQVTRGSVRGRYTILGLSGQGAMGEVYAAYDQELDRKVALKLLRASPLGRDDERGRARLQREAKAMARLSHRNVVSVHDTGIFDGRVFVAMEFVDGITLKEWLAKAPRTQAEILRTFILAGQGLEAAHAVGLVHRDFKPQNVMVATDGAVRVTDFGLARSLDDDQPQAVEDDARTEGASGLHLTRTGELLGTPLYMAPEQFKTEKTDARSDQFSFCVALYQALYGAPPFGDTTLERLMADVLAGRVQRPPATSTVPGWLRRVLLRGLTVNRDARWPSMTELLASLATDPVGRRRRRGLAVGVVALISLAGFAIVRRADRPEQLCRAGPARLAGTWGADTAAEPRRAAMQHAFMGTGLPAANEIWVRAAAVLDRYAGEWLAMYRDACEATHVRRQQSAAILELRMSCLDQKRSALGALTDVLATADRDVLSKALDAVNALPPLAACADIKALEAVVAPPRDAATRARVDDIRERAARAKALTDTGKTTQSYELARALVKEAKAVRYAPLLAETLLLFSCSRGTGYFSEELARAGEESVWTAIGAGRDDVAAEAACRLGWGVGFYLGRPQDGERWLRLLDVLLDRLGPGHELLRAWRIGEDGSIKSRENKAAEALELMRASRAIKEKLLPPGHPDIAISLQNEAEILHCLGREEEAVELSERVYAAYVRAYGPGSFLAAASLSNRGEYLVAAGRPGEAERLLPQAVASFESQVGPRDPVLGYPLTALGRARLAEGRPSEALVPLERANRLRETGEGDKTLVAETRFALARALWAAGGDRGRARELAVKARAGYAEAGTKPKDLAAVEAWSAAHTRSSRVWSLDAPSRRPQK